MLLRRISCFLRHSGTWKHTNVEACVPTVQQRCSTSLAAQPQSASAMASVSASARALLVDTLDMVRNLAHCSAVSSRCPPPFPGTASVHVRVLGNEVFCICSRVVSPQHDSWLQVLSMFAHQEVCMFTSCIMTECTALQMRSFERLGLTRYGSLYKHSTAGHESVHTLPQDGA